MRPDEDAVTLAAEASSRALPPGLRRVAAIVFASITGTYAEGGSCQPLAEMLGLEGDVFALDLSASRRDGLAAVRLAADLARPGAPVLICASHVGAPDSRAGSGAVALVIGDAADVDLSQESLATLTPAAASARELRDEWRLPHMDVAQQADRSFAQAIGTDLLTRQLLAMVPEDLSAPPLVTGPDARASADLARSLGGPPDVVSQHVGDLGTAQPLLRLLAGLDAESLVVGVSNGLCEAVHVRPSAGAATLAADVRQAVEHQGTMADGPMRSPVPPDFNPYSSTSRSWRDRDVDFRLRGLVRTESRRDELPARVPPTGTVIAWTRDHLYPGAETTEMVVVTMDDGGQFYGQVCMGDHAPMGSRVQLVPRRLHQGGGMIQYFWKVQPCP